MIVIIDYGMGNLKSVENALNYLNIECKISSNEIDIRNSDGLILPGVGAFKDAMDNLDNSGLTDIIKEEALSGKPLLGICLGMQMLFEKGHETGVRDGLGLLKGHIIKMEPTQKVKIPHIGWNNLVFLKNDSIIDKLCIGEFVYYVHSYYAFDYDIDNLLGFSNYGGIKIPGIVRKDNIMGAQFHPEKSGDVGLQILKNFGEMIK